MVKTASKSQAVEGRRAVHLPELSDSELVAAHLEGHPGAFTELYDRYRDRLVHFIGRKTGDRDRAEDLVQEAFIRVTRHLHRFDQTKKFSTWIYTICCRYRLRYWSSGRARPSSNCSGR